MKLVNFLVLALTFTLFGSSFQVSSNKSLLENSLLFNMWRKVPGATTQKPQYLEPQVTPKVNNGFANVVAEGWLSIASSTFKDETRFPIFKHPDGSSEILTSDEYERINEKYKELPLDANQTAKAPTDPNSPPGRNFFYFRMNKQYLYFAEDKACMNVLGSLDFENTIEPSTVHFVDPLCFQMSEKSGNTWKYCAQKHEDAKKFLCQIQTFLRAERDEYCQGKKPEDVPIKPPTPKSGDVVEKIITQPYILIPLAQKMCNENWNYAKHGKDWGCLCKEGK